MRGMTPQSHGQFWAGFAAAVLLVAAVGVGGQLIQWVAAHPQPQATIAWATAERYSVLDVLAGLVAFGTLTVMFWSISRI